VPGVTNDVEVIDNGAVNADFKRMAALIAKGDCFAR